MDEVVILGAGAFAREVFDWASQVGRPVKAFFATTGDLRTLRGCPVVSDAADLPENGGWIAGVGDPGTLAILSRLASSQCPPAAALVHPSVVLGSNVSIGAGSVVCPRVVLT